MKVSTLLQVAPIVMALLAVDLARGQNDSTVSLQVSPAKAAVTGLSYRALGPIGSKAPAPATIQNGPAFSQDELPVIDRPGFYPADVSNPANVPGVLTTMHHPIYVDALPSHWGNVGKFLTDLGKSDFIHVLDQYIGSSANNRYTLGTSFIAPDYPIPANHTLLIGDIFNLVYAGASIKGNGFGHIYHVFLPKGVDMCLYPFGPTGPPQCYSPDNPNTFYFCAFHGSVTFSDAVGHVLFSVEPYQDAPGCSVPPTGTANNQLIDSTNNVLSHETFEALSDPDGYSWWVQAFTFAYGNEIGDLCERSGQFGQNFYWKYGQVELNGHPYTVQPEYSNQLHGCTYSPQ